MTLTSVLPAPHPLGITIHMAYPTLVPPPGDTSPPFDDLDRRMANAEGWDLWDCHGTEGSAYQIQVFDYPDEVNPELDGQSLPPEPEAIALIVARALDGSPLHLRTLHHLYWACQEEWRWAIAMYRWEVDEFGGLPEDAATWVAEAHPTEEN